MLNAFQQHSVHGVQKNNWNVIFRSQRYFSTQVLISFDNFYGWVFLIIWIQVWLSVYQKVAQATRNYEISAHTSRRLQSVASSDRHPQQVLYCRCLWCLLAHGQAHSNIIVCLYMRVARVVIRVMRGRCWLEGLRNVSTLSTSVTTYSTGRSHSL